MSISKFIKKVCVQDCVYWGNPKNDGFGQKTYDDPIEIKCRWEDKIRLLTDAWGKEIRTKADVLLTRSVDAEGYLYLGSLSDFAPFDDVSKPEDIDGAYPIIAFDKIPLFRSTDEFVNTVYLGFSNIQK